MLVTEIAEHPMKAEEALELVGHSHRLDNFPSQLSGGEQQRVAIAPRHRQTAGWCCSAMSEQCARYQTGASVSMRLPGSIASCKRPRSLSHITQRSTV